VAVRLERELEAARLGWDGEIKIAAEFKRERDECRRLLREAVNRCDSTSSIRRYDGLRLGEDWFNRAARAAGGVE
jgi:hypothetical protein